MPLQAESVEDAQSIVQYLNNASFLTSMAIPGNPDSKTGCTYSASTEPPYYTAQCVQVTPTFGIPPHVLLPNNVCNSCVDIMDLTRSLAEKCRCVGAFHHCPCPAKDTAHHSCLPRGALRLQVPEWPLPIASLFRGVPVPGV